MKVYCDECKKEVDTKSLEEVEKEEAPEFNATYPHVHCLECGGRIKFNNK